MWYLILFDMNPSVDNSQTGFTYESIDSVVYILSRVYGCLTNNNGVRLDDWMYLSLFV
jgi:hypothetical protein